MAEDTDGVRKDKEVCCTSTVSSLGAAATAAGATAAAAAAGATAAAAATAADGPSSSIT